MPSLYEDLGVSATATPEEIKAAGRKAAKAHHPDMGGDAERFDATQKALKVLLDPERRAHYDRTGDAPTGSPEAMEQAEAHGVMAQYLNQAMDAGDPRFNHLSNKMKAAANESIAIHKQNLKTAEIDFTARIAKLAAYAKRVKGGQGNSLSEMLRGQIASMEQMLAHQRADAEHNVRINERVIAMLDGVDYVVDPQPAQPTYGSDPHSQMLRLLQEELRRQGMSRGGAGNFFKY